MEAEQALANKIDAELADFLMKFSCGKCRFAFRSYNQAFCGGVLSPKAIEKMLHDMKDSGSLIPASLLAIRTDLEKFVELYKGFGVECKVNKTKDGSEITLACEGSFSYEEYETASDKFDGYPGFHTDITFDNDGKFIEQGFWE